MNNTMTPMQFAGGTTPDGIRRAIHTPSTGKGLSDAVRVRLDTALVQRLDRIEALARGAGMRDVTRSTLIRTALETYVEAVEQELSLPSAAGPSNDGGAAQ
ncbi:hypothetical protein ACFQU3_19785 [Terrabacter sp. GCM10028922]|uniref:hypothetical protein n=1 Tax=Terrabacter sp. GCM10028922 TaxID=3273428 RepID=UPI003607E324